MYVYAVVDHERQLCDVTVDGKPLDPDRRYLVATKSFLAGGGDGFGLTSGRRVGETSKFLRDLMIDHLHAVGTVELVGDERVLVRRE